MARTDKVAALEKHVRKRFTPVALEKLAAHRWPGNVRELRNVVQFAFAMTESEQITNEWLPNHPPSAHTVAASGGSEDFLTIQIRTSKAEVQRVLILATLRHYNQHKETSAHAVRAILLANATAATLSGRRTSKSSSHLGLFLACAITARAP